ncbi:hypothetical protein MuYL_0266 [Mucilaginibacter xinganensis]|uniref:Uncharacterized protein n=1 Tax=Mucilaginibacter xinganensis TaxID=1234841 RepID=A0A223NQI3_9SPHI|nr:hypothetical protein MuYL_0266 [Mucilaginibacter xinganensis]
MVYQHNNKYRSWFYYLSAVISNHYLTKQNCRKKGSTATKLLSLF